MAISIARILSQLRIPVPISMGGTGSTTADSARSALGVPGRNRIINGACSVAQKGPSAYPNGVGGVSGVDRFFASNALAGGQFTQSLSTMVYGGLTKNCVMQTVNSAITDYSGGKFWSGVRYLIEGYDCYDLIGQPVIVSFIFRASVTGTYSLSVQDSTPKTYLTTFSATANTPVKVSVAIPSIPTNAVIPQSTDIGMQVWIGALNGGTYLGSTLNSWVSNNYISATGATNWGLTAGATIAVTELQLEVGSIATPFERIHVGEELVRCQRYYEVVSGTVDPTQGNWVHRPYKVTKRVPPSLSLVSGGLGGSGLESTSVYSFRTNPTPTSAADFLVGAYAELGG